MTDTLYRVSIHTVPSLAEVLEEALPGAGHAVSVWVDAAGTVARIDLFAPDREAADLAVIELKALTTDLCQDEPWRISVEAIPREDWAESWKRFFHPERVSDRVIVRPSWETMPARPGDVEVVIDAGMCFGTGQHGTTRACIRFLDALAAAGRTGPMLDAGCGSGILSIAAVKLGFGPVTAIDFDASAVEQAAENCRQNGVAESMTLETADVLRYAPAAPFGVVAANIEAPILLAAASVFADRLCAPQSGAALLLAGILERQYADIATAFSSRGFAERQQLTLDGWTSGWWERR
jgi:ribosomal protein L11 methyltransferase